MCPQNHIFLHDGVVNVRVNPTKKQHMAACQNSSDKKVVAQINPKTQLFTLNRVNPQCLLKQKLLTTLV